MPVHYLDLWDSNEKREQELKKRLEFAKLARRKEEAQWEQNERAVFASRFEEFFTGGDVNLSFESVSELGLAPVDSSASNIAANYIMKNGVKQKFPAIRCQKWFYLPVYNCPKWRVL